MSDEDPVILAADAELAALKEENERLKKAVEWALGELEREVAGEVRPSDDPEIRKVQEGLAEIIRKHLSGFAAELRRLAFGSTLSRPESQPNKINTLEG